MICILYKYMWKYISIMTTYNSLFIYYMFPYMYVCTISSFIWPQLSYSCKTTIKYNNKYKFLTICRGTHTHIATYTCAYNFTDFLFVVKSICRETVLTTTLVCFMASCWLNKFAARHAAVYLWRSYSGPSFPNIK